jgi:two-component system chemotaxis response regulator CheB
MRNLVSRMLNAEPDITVVGTAMNGRFALQKLPKLDPDIIVLDIEMPEMNGIEFLEERRKQHIDVPVVILSSVAERGAKVTMDALSLGASDFILKPSGSVSADVHKVGDQLIETVRGHGRKHRTRRGGTPPPRPTAPEDADRPRAERTEQPEARHRPANPTAIGGQVGTTAPVEPAKGSPREPVRPETTPGEIQLIAIGISTGGPNALRKMFAQVEANIGVPIVIVQHMPAGFTAEFAKSLDRICPLSVKEAEEGDLLQANRVLIAPGDHHLSVERRSLSGLVHVGQDPPRNGHRPSVDVLFESVAAAYGNHSLAVIMTGMGRDGAAELGTIRRRGGITIGQDEASSVVYGMPKVAYEMGHVEYQLPLHEIASKMAEIVREQNG